MENSTPSFGELTELLLGAYSLITKLLAQLPVPIGVPSINDDDWDPAVAVEVFERVRKDLIPDQPLTTARREMVQHLLLDWVTVYELGALITLLGPADWRLDAMDYGLHRVTLFAYNTAEELGIELDV